jgi:hypothetical protein
MITNAPHVIKDILSSFHALCPKDENEEISVSFPLPKVKIPKNVAFDKMDFSGNFQSSDVDEDSDDDADDDSDEDDVVEIDVGLNVPVSDVLVFVSLTGTTETLARRTLNDAYNLGLTMDHAVEYYFTHS